MLRILFGFLIILFLPSLTDAGLIKIRMLALQHSYEKMATDEIDLIEKVVKEAKEEGLDIDMIGRHRINQDGELKSLLKDMDKFKAFISKRMKDNAKPDDILIIFTVGHGAPNGGLHHLEKREDVIKAIAEAAEENNQKTLWWQLSCYASAHLPPIQSLSPKQRELLSIVASSSANQSSPAYVEYKPIGKMLTALAKLEKDIDPNQDMQVTGHELKKFLNSINNKRGHLFYTNDLDDIVFGVSIARLIPIIDKTQKQGKYKKDYIKLP